MVELAVAGLDRVKKTGELKVEPWKPFDYRTHSEKLEDAEAPAPAPVPDKLASHIKTWLDSLNLQESPSFIREIVGIRPAGAEDHYTVDVIVFDGQLETVDVPPIFGAGWERWHKSEHGPFHWDVAAKAWARLPVDLEDAA